MYVLLKWRHEPGPEHFLPCMVVAQDAVPKGREEVKAPCDGGVFARLHIPSEKAADWAVRCVSPALCRVDVEPFEEELFRKGIVTLKRDEFLAALDTSLQEQKRLERLMQPPPDAEELL